MLLRPKSLLAGKNQLVVATAVAALLGFLLLTSSYLFSSSSLAASDLSSSITSTTPLPSSSAKPAPVHKTDTFVKASLTANSPLKKPLEVLSSSFEVSCPERGGKNTQCGKVYAEYHFKPPSSTAPLYLYIQVRAPTLNDNSLWVAHVGASLEFFEDGYCRQSAEMGQLVPHKHRAGSSSSLLCCPKYLGKNAKKGLAGFYSDCCYDKLGKQADEQACVLDLEVDDAPRWNQFPREIRPKEDDDEQVVVIRIYAREDGTSWTGLVLSQKPDLDDSQLNRMAAATRSNKKI